METRHTYSMFQATCRRFLSYLWGMETNFRIVNGKVCNFCSYPTYEEWKQPRDVQTDDEMFKGSYPTYEEWKLPNNNIIPKAI